MARVRSNNSKRQRSDSPAEESSNASKRPKSSLHDKLKRSKSSSPEIEATKRTKRTRRAVSIKRKRADVPSPSSPLSPSKTVSSPFPRGEEEDDEDEDDFDELASQAPELSDYEKQGNEEDSEYEEDISGEEDIEWEENEADNGGQSQDAVAENPQQGQPELDDRSLFREFTTLISSSPSAVRSTPKEGPQTPPRKELTPPALGSNSGWGAGSGLEQSPGMSWEVYRALYREAYSRSPSGAPHTPTNRRSPGKEQRALTSEERLDRELQQALRTPSNQGRNSSQGASPQLPVNQQVVAEAEAEVDQAADDVPADFGQDSVPIVVSENDEDAEVEMTGSRLVPRPPVDLFDSPEPSYQPLSPLQPGRFRYYRPGWPAPRDRQPDIQFDAATPTDWTFDYDFSDEDDVPKVLLQREAAETYFGKEGELKWDPDTDDDVWDPENENGDADFEEGESFEPGTRTKNNYMLYSKPRRTYAWDEDHEVEHEAAQKRREEKFKTRMKELDEQGVSSMDLMKTGLGMNRIMRIYYNGAQRGSASLGEESGRAQGAVHDRPQLEASAFVPTDFDKRELPPRRERKGLEALVRNRDRVKQALDGIHIFFKICFGPTEQEFTTQQHQQERLAACMRLCRGDAFRAGFEVVSPRDLQTISRICRFGEAQYKTPELRWAADEEPGFEEVWEV